MIFPGGYVFLFAHGNWRSAATLLLVCVTVSCVWGCGKGERKNSESANSRQPVAMTGEAFLPETWPPGFALVDSIRLYGTGEQPARDGTIFDYIDGGGVVFIEHGMKTVTHAVLANGDGINITVDIYDFDTAQHASAAFADEMICPPGFTECDIGESCKSYAYVPDYLIYVLKSRSIVFCSTTDDRIADTVMDIARTVTTAIP